VSSPAASTASWSEHNAIYEANTTASLQAVHNAYANVALLTLPHSPNFIFPGTTLDYIYNPLLTAEERNATPPYSPVPYALLKLAEEALRQQQLDEEDGSPLPTLQYPLLEAFIPDEEISVEELLPPQVFAPVAVIPSPVPESPVLHQGPAPTVFPVVKPAVLLPYQHFDKSPAIHAYNEADLYTHTFLAPHPAPQTPATTPTNTPFLSRTVRTFGLHKRSSPTETSYVSFPTVKTSLRHSPTLSPLSGLKSFIRFLYR
jgi:hypothetical protein